MSASLRDRDDYVNAVVGGVLAGSVFGVTCKFLISELETRLALDLSPGLPRIKSQLLGF